MPQARGRCLLRAVPLSHHRPELLVLPPSVATADFTVSGGWLEVVRRGGIQMRIEREHWLCKFLPFRPVTSVRVVIDCRSWVSRAVAGSLGMVTMRRKGASLSRTRAGHLDSPEASRRSGISKSFRFKRRWDRGSVVGGNVVNARKDAPKKRANQPVNTFCKFFTQFTHKSLI